MNPLLALAIRETPAILGYLKILFATQHPDQPLPSDEDVISAYEAAFSSSLAKDDQWLDQHPE